MSAIRSTIALVSAGALIFGLSACSSSGSTTSTPSTGTSSSSSDTAPIATIAALTGESTSVALDSNFVAALTSLKLTPGLIGKATMSGTTVTFPITGGNVTLYKKGAVTPYVVGKIMHQGSGLSLTGGSTTVGLENFVVDPGKPAYVSGDVLVNGKVAASGVHIFYLDGHTLAPITTTAGVTKLTGTRVLLSNQAAALLDSTFKTQAVKGNLLVGIATILAK